MPISNEQERIINKVKRFSLVVTLRKIMPFVSILGIFFLSTILGVWNVQSIEYEKDSLINVDNIKLDESLNIFLGKNIFLVDVHSIEDEVELKNTFVKRVEVDKVIPNKLKVTIEEYVPRYGFIFSNKCNLYAQEGVKIHEVCEDCVNECKVLSQEWKSIYIQSDDSLDSNGVFMYSEEIGNIINVLLEFGYVISEIEIEDGVTTLKTGEKQFVFDVNEDLDTQLARMYLVGKKINSDSIEFETLDLRFDRPVLKNS